MKMKMKMISGLCLLLCVFQFNLYAQSPKFKIYYFENRYSKADLNYLNRYSVFSGYNLFSQGYLESVKYKGHIDLNKVKRNILKAYPNESASDYLVLDFEGKVYQDLRNYEVNDSRFRAAEKEFIQMVRLVKRLRPNLKVGIYGLPFKFYYNNQRKYNADNKFDNILRECDFIAPSLYLLYSENEVNAKRNKTFLSENLNEALDIGNRIQKPVIPFFWYMVNPINKSYGGEIVSTGVLNNYIHYIKGYRFKNQRIKGIFWWDVSEKYFKKYMDESNKGKRRKNNIRSKQDLFEYYKLEKHN